MVFRGSEIQLGVLRILLATPNHVSVREIARQLRLPPGHVFYHLQRMVELGVLVKREWSEEEGDYVKDYVEYEPQAIFSEKSALSVLSGLYEYGGITNSTPEKFSNCVAFLLRLREKR